MLFLGGPELQTFKNSKVQKNQKITKFGGGGFGGLGLDVSISYAKNSITYAKDSVRYL